MTRSLLIIVLIFCLSLDVWATRQQAELNTFFYDQSFVYTDSSKDFHKIKELESGVEPATSVLIHNAFNINTTDPRLWEVLFQERLHSLGLDVTALANQVSMLVHEYGPFLSLSEFVNGQGGDLGILQEALNNLAINDRQKPQLAPDQITQADILQLLEPVLVTREDTFVIKSYGDVVNPKTGKILARAWCEAVVQRMPDVGGEGRRFEVVRVQWLR